MFKIEKLNINLDRQNSIFNSGETILGSLEFTVKSATFAQSIRLLVDGQSFFAMYEKQAHGGVTRVEGYDAYLKFFINFLPVEVNQRPTLLNPGDYSYRFEIKLPKTLPPTFQHTYGIFLKLPIIQWIFSLIFLNI